jgi:hypothetical protein
MECSPAGSFPAQRAAADAAGGREEAALSAGLRAGIGAVVLGLVLASGLRLCPFHTRSTALRVCVRHVAVLVAPRYLHSRLRSVSRHLQHESVSLVQTGLVLSAVRNGGGGAGREGTDSLEPGRKAGAHFQSLVVSTRRVFRSSCWPPARAASHGAGTLRTRSSSRRRCTWYCFSLGCPASSFSA